MTSIICPYCGGSAPLIDSAAIYHGRSYGMIYRCDPCDAHVGVHKGTENPLSRLANKELRKWKQAAHAIFDPIWQAKYAHRVAGGAGKSGRPGGQHYKKVYARNSAYKWLADQMGITRKECHIGMFDADQCQRVIEICSPVFDKIVKKAGGQ
jgi:hypothetical protein